MDVPKINLLQSAKKLLQEKRNTAPDSRGEQTKESDKVEFSSTLSSKYYNIHNRLKEEQSELTKTQTKLGILSEPNLKKEGLINILFGKTPLFQEIQDAANFDENVLKNELLEKKERQISTIKSLEVESENIMSAGMLLAPDAFSATLKKIDGSMIKNIPEKVVEKLITD